MNNRLPRVNELLKREIGKILLKEIVFEDAFITITRAESSSDLSNANIFVSVIPEKQSEKVLKFFNAEIYNIQKLLDKKLKMRPVPKIKFVKEKMTQEAFKIESILERLKKEKK
jgi:ribosome-binding factor A